MLITDEATINTLYATQQQAGKVIEVAAIFKVFSGNIGLDN